MSSFTEAEVSRYLSAARQGSLDDVRDMLAAGMDVDASDSIGRTALMGASTHTDPDMVRYLISEGAQVSKRDYRGETALHLSVGATYVLPDPRVVELLLDAGAPVNAKNEKGWTPLMRFVESACSYRPLDIVQRLEDDHLSIITLLIQRGANIHERNHEQDTVHHIISREIDSGDPKKMRAILASIEGASLEMKTPALTRVGHTRRI